MTSLSDEPGTVALEDDLPRQAGLMGCRGVRVASPPSSFAGFPFPPEVIMVAVRWYLRYGLSYRDVEELPAERGVAVDQTVISFRAPRVPVHTGTHGETTDHGGQRLTDGAYERSPAHAA
jgi:hypothetical protein